MRKFYIAKTKNDTLCWAELISNLASPPVVWSVAAFPMAFRNASSFQDALRWAMIYIILVCILPSLYVIASVKRGVITDIHMKVRRERMRPFAVSVAFAAIAWIAMLIVHASPVMRIFAAATLFQLSVMLLITLRWQVSIHMISITAVTVAVGMLFNAGSALLITPLIFIVAMARLKLKRHSKAEIIAGAMIGIVSVALLLMLTNVVEPGILTW